MRTQAETAVSAWRPAVANHVRPLAIHFTALGTGAVLPLQHDHISFNRKCFVIPFATAKVPPCPGQQSDLQTSEWQDRPKSQQRKAACGYKIYCRQTREHQLL